MDLNQHYITVYLGDERHLGCCLYYGLSPQASANWASRALLG